MSAEADREERLDDAVEAEWARLHDQIELADGFWLAWVFSTAFDAPRMMAERVRRTLQESGAKLRCWRPETPKELREVLPELLDAVEEGTSDCLWVEALAVDVPGVAEEASWSWAWRELLMRANERRERLLRAHRGGVVFVGAPEVKVLARENAPDLWAVRAMVIDVPRAVPPTVRGIEALLESIRVPLREDRVAVKKELAEAIRRGAEDALARAKEFMAAARPLISWAYVLLQEMRPEEARALMTHLLQLRRTNNAAESPFEARAYAVLAECDEIQGDRAAATDHYRAALRNAQQVSQQEFRRWAMQCAELLVRQSEFEEAQEILRGVILRTRAELGRDQSSDVLRALGAALAWLARVQLMRREFRASASTFEEASMLYRKLLERHEEDESATRLLALTLSGTGVSGLASLDVSRAEAAFSESLALMRSAQGIQQEQPDVLRGLVEALLGLGTVRIFQDRPDEAEKLFFEARELVGRLRELKRNGLFTGHIPDVPLPPESPAATAA